MLKEKLIFSILSTLLTLNIWGAAAGKILQLKGVIYANQKPLQQGDLIIEGHLLTTDKASMAKIEMSDKTILTLGPESRLAVKSYHKDKGKRVNRLDFVLGKVRVWVREHAQEGEKIEFITNQVNLGVRGTEFLTSAYDKAGKITSDTYLLEGQLDVAGNGFEKFNLEAGQVINSDEVLTEGAKAVKKIDPAQLKNLIENKDGLGVQGSHQAPTSVPNTGAIQSSSVKPVIPLPVPGLDRESEKKKHKKVSSKVQGVLAFTYDVKKEPWQIRDAVLKREENKKNNDCFYFFYKKLPGAGEEELFRRERNCDDFEFDL